MRAWPSRSPGSTGVVFEQSAFAQVVAGSGGRIARIVAGLALIATGWVKVGGTKGAALATIGLAPLAAGLLDVCLIAPVFGASFWGRDIRARGRAGRGLARQE